MTPNRQRNTDQWKRNRRQAAQRGVPFFVDGPTTQANQRAYDSAFRARGVSEADIVAAYVGTDRHPRGSRTSQLRIEQFRPSFKFA